MFDGLLSFMCFAVPVAIVVFFIVSLAVFVSDRGRNKKNPGTVPEERIHREKVLLIVSSILIAVVILLFIALVIILANAIAYM